MSWGWGCGGVGGGRTKGSGGSFRFGFFFLNFILQICIDSGAGADDGPYRLFVFNFLKYIL